MSRNIGDYILLGSIQRHKAITAATLLILFIALIPIFEANTKSASKPAAPQEIDNPDTLNHSKNPTRTMWLDNRYLYGNSPVKNVAQAKAFLNSIANPDFIYLRPARVYNGNPSVVSVMTLNFASLIHSASSRTKVLAIVDIVTEKSSDKPNDPDFLTSDIYCDLSNASSRNTLVETMSQVVNKNDFDGVYLDIEPLNSGTAWLPQMIEQFKALTDGKTVIVYGFSLVDDSQAGKYDWSTSYLKTVCSFADYVELRLYNFRLQTPEAYKEKVQEQITRVESAGLTQKILFNLPAYPASPNHDPAIENIANAGPLVQKYNTGLFSQVYMTETNYAEYLGLFAK